MIKRRRFPKIYFGWWMNLVMGITSGVGGGFTQLGASALFKPIAAELGLSRAVTSVATSMARLQGGIQSPITGILSDKFGSKWLVVGGTCLVSIGLLWMYFVNSVWTYYIAWGVILSTGFNIGLTIAQDKVLTDWFISKRGLAFGIRFGLLGIMSVITLPIISWLITTYGWRMACLTWTIVMFASVPLSWHFVRQHRPEYYGLLPDGATVESGPEVNIEAMVDKGVEYASSFQETEFTLRQAIRTSSYWLLVISQCAMGIIYGAVYLHCIPLLTDLGIEPGAAAGMMSLMAFVTIPSRFAGGFLSDRFSRERLNLLMAGAFFIQAVAITAFLLSQTLAVIYIFLMLVGLGSGAVTPLHITMRGRYFGRKAYGSIQGTTQLFAAPISIIAPIYAGWVYDVTGNYINAFTVFAVIAALTVVLMLFLRPPKPPAEATDLRRFM